MLEKFSSCQQRAATIDRKATAAFLFSPQSDIIIVMNGIVPEKMGSMWGS